MKRPCVKIGKWDFPHFTVFSRTEKGAFRAMRILRALNGICQLIGGGFHFNPLVAFPFPIFIFGDLPHAVFQRKCANALHVTPLRIR